MDEKVLLEAKPTWIIIIPHIVAMCALIGFFTIWKAIISILTSKLKVTDKRVEGRTGLIKTENMDSRLGQITSVKVVQGLVGKIFNYGTVYINTAGGNYEFSYIHNPEEVRKSINLAIDSLTIAK